MESRRLPSLNSLRVFESVARTLNFSETAAELNVSPSAVSKSVRVLEAHFEMQLVLRSTGRMQLTEAGAKLAGDLARAFDQIRTACHHLRPPSSLKLRVPMSFGDQWLIPKLDELQRQTNLNISATGVWNQRGDFEREGYDLAVIYDPPNDGIRIYSERLVCVASPVLLGEHKESDTETLLAQATRIAPSKSRDDWAAYLTELDIKIPAEKIIQVESMTSAIQATLQGAGVAVVDPLFVSEELIGGALRLVHPSAIATGCHYHLLMGPHIKGTSDADLFINWLKKEISLSEERLIANLSSDRPAR